MSYLTENDYLNMIKFNLRLNQDYSNFVNESLRSLDELFHFYFTCYVVLNKDVHNVFFVQDVKSNTMWPVFQEQFKSRYYKEDGFLTNLPKLRFNNPNQHAFFWDDAANSVKPSYDYLNLLSSHGIAYAALVGASPYMYAPMHVLLVFKTESSGPFNEHERELLQFIGQTFSNSIKSYKMWLQTQHVLSVMEHLFESFPNGYGILTQNGTLVYHSSKFAELTSVITNEPNFEQNLKKLIQVLPLPLGDALHNHEYGKVFKREFNEILLTQTIEKHFLPNGYEVLHCIIVEKETQTDCPVVAAKPLSSEIMLKYSLTMRESEVLCMLVNGANNNDIAACLFVSDSTVRSHIRNIYSKLGVSKRSELLNKVQPKTHL